MQYNTGLDCLHVQQGIYTVMLSGAKLKQQDIVNKMVKGLSASYDQLRELVELAPFKKKAEDTPERTDKDREAYLNLLAGDRVFTSLGDILGRLRAVKEELTATLDKKGD